MKEKKMKGSRSAPRPTRIVVERKYVGDVKMEEVFRHIAEEEIQNKANKFIESAQIVLEKGFIKRYNTP